ncbi:plasma-membrane choline transporter-domain-containing protein [Armillaria luteobubalina]|uniref:Protein PNS1 n=1 Tax=Armillaria luteobubalina TaxID=153913 RepID=A0AA39Q605_9AGAR|nr:plasma-membrane choline transporter-domain-containing protein [Armillaria luteobubalina]
MATSFAAFASQILNRPQNGETSMASSQPMFFSFTTDSGSRAEYGPDADINDLDDPHLRESHLRSGTISRNLPEIGDEDDEDPYLRLDEEEQAMYSRHDSRHRDPQSRPLISSDRLSDRSDSPHGWLAHQASPLRDPSPSPSESTDSEPLPEFLTAASKSRPHPPPSIPPPPPTGRQPVSLSLTDSLLPRDGTVRPLDVFSLPDPRHVPRGRRKFNDFIWTALWCAGLSLCLLFSIILLFMTPKSDKSGATLRYTTLLHTVPLITILTFVSAFVAYTHVLLLRIFVRPVMIITSVFIPATLFISAIWAFVGSFMWDGDTEPTWGETTGLRLFSLFPLVLSILTARRLISLPRDIHSTSSTLTLATQLLMANPFLLALSPTILLATLLASIPFITLIFRLLLIGYFQSPYEGSSSLEWHVRGWANWSITATVAIWLWTWGVARGVLRMTCASVIGAWYFANPDAPPPPPMSTHTIHAALTRSTGPSLGTVVVSALILTAIRLLTLLTLFFERLPLYMPARALFLVSGIRVVVGFLEGITTALSKYALVYVGITGDPFMPSARRARALTNKVGKRGFSAEPPLTLLTVAPLTLTFPFALSTYLFVAHTLNAPDQALGAAMLAGGVTALVGLFCVGLVRDTADTLYMCYCIDKDLDERKREEVFQAFEYGYPSQATRRSAAQATPSRPQQANTSSHSSNDIHPEHWQQPSSPPPPVSHRSPPPPPPVQQSIPEPVEEDVDPFQQSYLQDDSRLLPQPRPSSQAAQNYKHESDSEEEGDGSQFFPGSGFF